LHDHSGKLEQSFGATLRDELNDYIRFVTLLETQVEAHLRSANAAAQASQALLAPAGSAEANNATAAAASSAANSAPSPISSFTLVRMWQWELDPTHRLRWLAMLVDAVRGVKGGAIASVVGSHMKHGESFVVELMKRLLRKTCVPLFEMIHKWVCKGVIEDPYSEFFIEQRPIPSATGKSGAPRMNPATAEWEAKFVLRPVMIPTFFPHRLVRRILACGKAVHFVRVVCGERNFTAQLNVDFNHSTSHTVQRNSRTHTTSTHQNTNPAPCSMQHTLTRNKGRLLKLALQSSDSAQFLYSCKILPLLSLLPLQSFQLRTSLL